MKILKLLFMSMIIIFICILIKFDNNFISSKLIAKSTNKKYSLWLKPGYFKGFNMGYWSSHDDYAKTLRDFAALKNTGANLVKINIYEGTTDWKYPYKDKRDNIKSLRKMISMCKKYNLYYIIDVRAGPGRRDVAEDHHDTIWINKKEQQKYARMLQQYVKNYGKDPLFIGLNIIVEPNPLWQQINSGQIDSINNLKKALKKNKINIYALYKYLIKEIRKIDKKLPCIVQNVNYSNPEWWGLMKKQSDPFIVYDVHSYVPRDYSHADRPNIKKYPGHYWCMSKNKYASYNKKLLNNTIFANVKKFQKKNNVPVILGEFGMQYPQYGGVKYLSDYVDIAKLNGWHFALWSFRSDDPGSKKHIDFDPEKWHHSYWKEVKSWFK